MIQTVDQFVAHALARERIGFGDVRRLERDILPGGLRSREDAEALLALAQAVPRADPAWSDYLATAVRDFALGSGGVLDRETAEWLVGGPLRERSRIGLAIARAIVFEASQVDEVLANFVEGVRSKPRRKPLEPQEAEEAQAEGSTPAEPVVPIYGAPGPDAGRLGVAGADVSAAPSLFGSAGYTGGNL